MNFRQIEVFHAIYVSGSITAASRTLHVSQPSISKILQHAESRLGFQLFRRVKGRLIPTEEAHLLFREVDDVYQRIGSLKLAVSNLRAGGAAHLRIAVLPALGLGVAPQAIAKFRESHPDVTFDVQTLDHVDILRCLYEREADIAIGFSAPAHPRLKSTRIGHGELVLLRRRAEDDSARAADVRADSRRREPTPTLDFRRRPPIAIRKLQGQDYISLTGSGPIGALLAGELARLDVQPREVASARTFGDAAALGRPGVGVTVVDEFSARAVATPEMQMDRLNPAVPFGVHGVWLEEKPPSPPCQEFLDTFAALLPQAQR